MPAGRVKAVALLLLLCTGHALTAAAAPPPPPVAHRSVALFTYSKTDGQLLPLRSFSGVLIDPVHIATSAYALRHPAALTDHRRPAQIRAVIWGENKPVVVNCKIADASDASPIAYLLIEPQDQPAAAKLGPAALSPADLKLDAASLVVGSVSASPAPFDQLDAQTVPPPVAMHLVTRNATPELAPLSHVMPPELLGAGVWSGDGQLLGLLTREHESLQVVQANPVALFLAANPVAVPAAAPQTPETPAGETASGPAVPVALKPLMTMVRHAGLQLAVDPGLLDCVNQDQADLVMARIAGGKPADALKFIDDIQPFASGRLWEQLNYRRALALTLLGRYAEAAPVAKKASEAGDPLVKSRGSALAAALAAHPDGKVDGKPLSDPATLGAAMKAKPGN